MILLVTATLLAGAVAARAGETILLRDGPSPDLLVVPAGSTVTWQNIDDERHRVRSVDGPREFDSGNLEPGESFSLRLALAGRYRYVDERREDEDDTERHEDEVRGTILVQAPAANPGETTRPVPTAAPPSAGTAASDATPTPAAAATGPTPVDPGASPSQTALATPSAVDIAERAYAPADVAIWTGGTVEWTNRDGEGHTVTALDGAFDSGLMAGGMTYARTFEMPGTFEYTCTIHPEMRGRVTVSAAPPTDPPATELPADLEDSPSAPPGVDAVAGDAGVSLIDVTYQPSVLEIAAGSTVRWTNDDPVVHTVTARDGSFNSGVMRAGDEFSLVFETPGSYDYFCAIHPGQAGSIIVAAPGD